MEIIVDRTLNQSMDRKYSIIYHNQSETEWSLICYQNQDTGLPTGYYILAWYAMPAAPNTKIKLSWQKNYCFTWEKTGKLSPEIEFTAFQTLKTDLTTNNKVTFTLRGSGAFTFQDQTTGPTEGSSFISQDDTIPLKTASVGMGMAEVGTYCVQAKPNVNTIFTPTNPPRYYVAFGSEINTGDVLDINKVSNPEEIIFPSNMYTAYATLLENNTWDITYSDKLPTCR